MVGPAVSIVRAPAAVIGDETQGLVRPGRAMVLWVVEPRRKPCNHMVSRAEDESIAQHGKRALSNEVVHTVKDTEYILRNYGKDKANPSLVLHLHPTHFRLDGQDGSFSYNSSMSSVLKHLKFETIPHEMMEYLLIMGVKFYEGRVAT